MRPKAKAKSLPSSANRGRQIAAILGIYPPRTAPKAGSSSKPASVSYGKATP